METKGAKGSGVVMVVDDDRDLLFLIQRVLRREGLEVEAFSTPPTMHQVKGIDPGVIFLDVELGTQSGEQVCRQLKDAGIKEDLPVVLISAKPVEDLREAAVRCGADFYLAKPFDMRGLARVAKEYLGKAA